ncbi:MAG: hypothetical protein LLG93_00325, partial [Deltaproteobacteria bacterium]|nr:hypothetical protein [Deltaproteobacteria bacterium]
MANPIRYAEQLLRVVDKAGREVPLRFNPIQRAILQKKRESYSRGRPPRYLVLKSRRCGVTTLEQAISYLTAAFRDNRSLVTLAHDDKSTEVIFRIADFFYERMPPFFRPRRLTEHNKRELNFPTRHSLFYIGTAGNKRFGRSATIQRAHLSEVAWWPGDDDDNRNLLAGILEATSHGEVVAETTPNGVGGMFHEMWQDAEKGTGPWTPLFFPWWSDPDNSTDVPEGFIPTEEERDLAIRHGLCHRQIAWRRAKWAELKKLAPQEYPEDPASCFLVGGSGFFNATLIKAMLQALPQRDIPEGGLYYEEFEPPRPGRQYFCGSDSAGGKEDGDDAVSVIIDDEMRQVAVLRGKIPPKEFAKRTAAMCARYNNALWGIERENHGHTVIHVAAVELGYP